MKLGLKIILPILLLLLIILGSFGYLLYNLKQQEAVISAQGLKIQKLNSLNERLGREQEQIDYNTLAYRFNQNRSFLLVISQAELDRSKILDEMSPFITSSKGKEFVNNYIDARKEVVPLRNDLIKAIDEGDKEQINRSYNQWSIRAQNIKAALSDIKAYNINSLEKVLAVSKDISNQITQVIITLALVVIATVVLFYFYLRVFITTPLIKLAQFTDEIAHKNFDTTTTTTTGINSKDEIGMLARGFNTMSAKLKEYYGELAQKVEEKTQQLDEKVKNLEDNKKATMNLLEDLEEEKNREETLAKDLEKFKLAVDNTSDMVVIADPEGIVIYGNKAVEKVTGYRVEEAIGKKSGALWKSPMPQEFYQTLWDTIKNQKKTFISEIQNKRKNGELYTSKISISPVLNKDGKVIFFVGIEYDITREKEIDKAKTEFVSMASHQLRTPLSTINWYLEMLLSEDKAKLNDDQKEYVNEAALASRRMVGLVNSLLNVSRIEMGTFSIQPEAIDIAEVIKACIKESEHKILEKKLEVTGEYDPTVPKVMADGKLLGIVVQNLLENALNYNSEGGKIKVSLKRKGNDILITVEDTGIGISENQKSKIFTKLFRADNAREKEANGNGLGLYMTKAILENSGGKVWFESEEDKGTAFYVTIPLSGMKVKEGTRELSYG